MRSGPAATPVAVQPLVAGVASEPPQNPADRTKSGKTRARIQGVLLVVAAIAIVALFRTFVVSSFSVSSASMEGTLHGCAGCASDVVMVDKFGYHFYDASRKDLVVFHRPAAAPGTDKELIMRVIGLPGETVSAHNGRVFIDGQALTEPYVNSICRGTAAFASVKIPAGKYFVMGDNRCNSFDSRRFGPIAKSSVVGRAFVVVWPSKHWRWIG
jgi:signal peptidase I